MKSFVLGLERRLERHVRLCASPPTLTMQRGSGAAWINIDGSDDPGYRYKMPPVLTRIERTGKSGHTQLDNALDISKALQRPPQYLSKFCGLAVGALSAYDKDQGAIDLRGAYSPAVCHELVMAFVRQWVLCPRCRLPETVIRVDRAKGGAAKKYAVTLDCQACGARAAADSESKLTSFILNNPPNLKGTGLK